MSPITSCLNGCRFGDSCAFSKRCNAEAFRCRKTSNGDGQHAGDVRAGLRHRDAGLEARERAIAEVAELEFVAVPLERNEQCGFALVEKLKFCGNTPMIWRGFPSTVMERPITEVAPPNFCRQYP